MDEKNGGGELRQIEGRTLFDGRTMMTQRVRGFVCQFPLIFSNTKALDIHLLPSSFISSTVWPTKSSGCSG